ncbi:MAG: hypothetical protein GY906_23470 [bacterium]|nr:hypothetical protein [bacterium]
MRHILTASLFLVAACSSSPRSVEIEERIVAIAETIGDTTIRLKGAAFIMEHAPALMPLIDSNGDQIITLEEVKAVDFDDPVTVVMLLTILQPLLEK